MVCVHFQALKCGKIKFTQLIRRLQELNRCLCFMSCLKHKLGSPAALQARCTNIPELELCIIILAAVLANVDTQCNAALRDNTFVVEVEVLLKKMDKICAYIAQEKRTLRDFADQQGV